jgi:hypothetical protein
MEKIKIWDQGSRMEKFGSRILDPGWETFGSGIQDPGFRIRDKHPRSAKLEMLLPNLLGHKEANKN